MFEEELSAPEVKEILSETVMILTNEEKRASMTDLAGKKAPDVLDRSDKGLVERRRVLFED